MSIEYQPEKTDFEMEQTIISAEMKKLADSIPEGKLKDSIINPFTVFLEKEGYDPMEYRLYLVLLGQKDPGNVINELTGKKFLFDICPKGSVDPYAEGLIQKFIKKNFKK